MESNQAQDCYAVMGNPIAHSLSPRIHTLFAAQTGQSLTYDALHVEPHDFAAAVRRFAQSGGKGLNITLPFKGAAYTLATSVTGRAQQAQAVNTLILRGAQEYHGDNTDGVGLVRDLIENCQVALAGRRVLLLGAGGAARGVLGPLLAAGTAQVHIANRTLSTAGELAQAFMAAGTVSSGGFDSFPGAFDIVINATSASLQGAVPSVALTALAPSWIAYDMMYGRTPTAFAQWATAHGAAIAYDGLGMLVEQAAEAFWLWRGVRPQTAPVLRALRAAP